MVRALKERKFFVSDGKGGFNLPPRPISYPFFSNRLSIIEKFIKRNRQYTSKMSPEQFLATYEGRRRTLYEEAFKSLERNDITVEDSHIKYFVKVEKIVKDNAVPRGIDPRNPRYHVELGRYIKTVEKIIYKLIDKMFGARTIFKGLNAFTRGKYIESHWNSFDEPVAVGLDASRFDQHVSKFALMWEHNIYKLFYPGDKYLEKLLRWQCTTNGVGYVNDGKVKFKTEGGRSSGDMNTALGNCLIMSSMVYAYAASLGMSIKLANDGDDCVVFMEQRDLKKFNNNLSAWFLQMGFNMTIEKPVFEIEHIEFCQSNPIWTPEGYIMVRNIHKALSKDCLSIKPLNNPKIARRWLSAVGQGGVSLTGGIPIWQIFYNRLHILSEGATALENDPTQETGLKFLMKGMRRQVSDVHPQTRASFFAATGILPDLQVAIEHQLKNLNFGVENQEEEAIAPILQ